jgi:hypothetical protein
MNELSDWIAKALEHHIRKPALQTDKVDSYKTRQDETVKRLQELKLSLAKVNFILESLNKNPLAAPVMEVAGLIQEISVETKRQLPVDPPPESTAAPV